MQQFQAEEDITLDQTQQIADILSTFDQMDAAQLQILAEGGLLIETLGVDLWKTTRPYPAIDEVFCTIENKTHTQATRHRRHGSITGDQVFLTALAVKSAIVAVLMIHHDTPATTELLSAAWLRATQS